MNKKTLMQGNIAICEGSIKAGCEAYFGYPITPQNEISAYMSKRMNDLGRVFLQAESELAAINMVLGVSLTGKRALTSSSSPGISLKQEGISYLCGCELPAVIVNVMRGGPGLGNISGSQSDYFQATKGGGHGDYRLIVLAPGSVQEIYDLTILSFELSDKYRNPSMLLIDGYLGQMMEPINLNRTIKTTTEKKDWILNGCKNRKSRKIRSLLMGEGELEKFNWKLNEKYQKIKDSEQRYEAFHIDDAEIILVAFGIAARICKGVVLTSREKGYKVGLIRPITLWPFPQKAFQKINNKKIIVVEMNLGQMIEDVKLSTNCDKTEIEFIGKPGGTIITPEEIMKRIVKSKKL